LVISTNQGIFTHEEARNRHIGGKIIGFFYWLLFRPYLTTLFSHLKGFFLSLHNFLSGFFAISIEKGFLENILINFLYNNLI
jgi:hypothetical protein